MGFLLSLFLRERPEIIADYCIPSCVEYLRRKGKTIVGIDRKYWVPVIDTSFGDYSETSVRLWSRISAHSNNRLLIKTPTMSSSDNSSEEEVAYDTVF